MINDSEFLDTLQCKNSFNRPKTNGMRIAPVEEDLSDLKAFNHGSWNLRILQRRSRQMITAMLAIRVCFKLR